jgi:hypothetical protein
MDIDNRGSQAMLVLQNGYNFAKDYLIHTYTLFKIHLLSSGFSASSVFHLCHLFHPQNKNFPVKPPSPILTHFNGLCASSMTLSFPFLSGVKNIQYIIMIINSLAKYCLADCTEFMGGSGGML